MDARDRRALAAYYLGLGLLPCNRERPSHPVPNDPKTRFLRALQFLTITDRDLSYSKAAAAAGIPRGTVASWLHRDSNFRREADLVIREAAQEYSLAELQIAPLESEDLEALERIKRLPESELARLAMATFPHVNS